ncbi:MAG: glycogen synthase [Proteobacteria bacterium]|nr:glycogen synthase [Pseudomonadota bacterium]
MNILMAAAEAVPFCKTGGLADVVGALSETFAGTGHVVKLFLPYYRAIERGGFALQDLPGKFWIPIGDTTVPASLSKASFGKAEAYFVHCPRYFGRDGLYQEGGKDFPDNDERFIFYARAVLEGAKFIDLRPEVIHAHDWQAALLPAYLKTVYRIDAFYSRTASALTIHNIAYQGMFNKDALYLAGFGWSDFTPQRLEYYGGFNFLKAGLVFADKLTTVSPTYAREIQASPEGGRGMEGVLRHRAKDLAGILNGIDTRAWDPARDGHLAARFGVLDVKDGKARNRSALLKECGLDAADGPVIGIVSRLDEQKGLDSVLPLVSKFVKKGVRWVVLGNGSQPLHEAFAQAAKRHPVAVHFHDSFDEPFAHRVYAGADIFLMPSRFEPCGLGQMIAMRYGAVPVVTRTGGLADTVTEDNGFVAEKFAPAEVEDALERAVSAFGRAAEWSKKRARALAADFSWDKSAAAYLEIYRAAAAGKAGE